MKVIYCMDARVVPWKPGMKFAALSYTWGSDTGPTLAEGETLPAALPRTVDDAIQLIKRLGLPDLRYLWADRYCIDQHRLDEKHDQIQQMHKIFSNADLTIIAAHGDNVDSGLPGIGATPRAPQSFIATADGALVFVEANMKSITQSPWMTRGWTFQEACFSRRRLFFTSEQVVFECADMTAQEVLRIPLRHGAGCTLKPLFGVHLSNVMGEQRGPFPYYVEEYSRRVLRYDSDALNAFSGILHALEQCEPRLHHLWAIQINNGRCMSLLWDMQHDFDMSQRRWDYPSWSWLGWKGPVTFSRLKVDTAPDVAIWVERLDGILRPIASISDAEHVTQNPGEYSRYIHIEACAFDVKVCLLGDVVALERETSDGTSSRAVIQRGNSSLLKSQLVGESLQAILLNRHELSDGIRNVATLLLVKQNKNGTASSRVGVCEVKWYPFGYFAEKSGRVKMTRLG
ncbi:hypothetical protein BFW01_g5431 [Lasiodiplodia theobromae]|nr:hypothetical protein BFW01_g5431 [Lasiodiplodia theobromae]